MTESGKDQENSELKAINTKLSAEIADLKEQLAYLTRKLYGHKHEQVNSDQISLFKQSTGVFTEPEQTGDQSSTAANQVQSKKAKKTRQEKVDQNLPARFTILEPTNHKCSKGHAEITPVGKNMFVRNYISFRHVCTSKKFMSVLISVNTVLKTRPSRAYFKLALRQH